MKNLKIGKQLPVSFVPIAPHVLAFGADAKAYELYKSNYILLKLHT